MASDTKIVELMAIQASEHDWNWLQESLQAAIKLEFATLPPYLTAMWSIKDRLNPIYRSIREIVREEMLHMSIMCNLLTALDGTPMLNTIDSVPSYPGPLPGGINPQLIVPVQRLSHQSVELFMEIEYPENSPVAFAETYPTIGAFYSAILEAFKRLQPPLSISRQIEGPLGLAKLATMQDVENAIELIVHQGEGSKDSPEDTGLDDLAHYYRFAEIFYGRKVQKNPQTGKWKFDGAPVDFPEVWPMAQVPIGGYQQADVSDGEVWQLIEQFDMTYSVLLNHLQATWQNGNMDELSNAIGVMFSLSEPAISLMQKPIANSQDTYGPCWRLLDVA